MQMRESQVLYVLPFLLLYDFVEGGSLHAQDASFFARRDFVAGAGPNSAAVGDFNGDGNQDLAVANNGSGDVSVLLGNGDGTFRAALRFGVGRIPRSVGVGDFNGDGWQDLAVANEDSNNVSVLINNTQWHQEIVPADAAPFLSQ